jgi:hypothetical protein
MSLRTVPRASFVWAFVLFSAQAAFAGASPEEEAKRLDDHLFFVKGLDRGWEPLLSDVDRTLASLGGAAPESVRPVRVTADTARETVAKMNLAKGKAGEGRALELFDQLAQTCVDESRRPAFHGECAGILMGQASEAEAKGDEAHDKSAFDLAMRALSHVPDLERAFEMIAKLGLKVGMAARGREDYDAALLTLDGTMTTLREHHVSESSPALANVKQVVDDIHRTTGPLSIEWLGDAAALLAVKGAKTDFTHAKLTFSGEGNPPPPQTADAPRRLRIGAWKVAAAGAGSGAPMQVALEMTPQGGSVTLIPAMPDGMVLVPAGGGDDAFLIDRTEVSNAEFQAMTGKPRGGNPHAAVAGITFEEASAAAKAAGKALPTLAQWTHAAFGAPNAKSPRYPWGDKDGEPGVEFVSGAEEAQDVESCPAGKSACGCLNMAGNVWEWIAYRGGGWLIGGGWAQRKFDLQRELPDGGSWTADLLRDPLPTADTYNAFTDAEKADQSKYYKYQATAQTTLPQAGMRCVVPLGKPRR